MRLRCQFSRITLYSASILSKTGVYTRVRLLFAFYGHFECYRDISSTIVHRVVIPCRMGPSWRCVMGVCCRGYSVIVRNRAVENGLIGGLDAYKQLCPNSTFCSDGLICRVGFMNLDDAKSFLSQLMESGLLKSGSVEDFTIVDQGLGILPWPDWLVFGHYEKVPIACLVGTEHVDLFMPQSELDSKMETISFKDLREMYDFVETKNNVEHYVHKVSGSPLFIGRTSESSRVERTLTDLTDRPSEQGSVQRFWKRMASRVRWRDS